MKKISTIDLFIAALLAGVLLLYWFGAEEEVYELAQEQQANEMLLLASREVATDNFSITL